MNRLHLTMIVSLMLAICASTAMAQVDSLADLVHRWERWKPYTADSTQAADTAVITRIVAEPNDTIGCIPGVMLAASRFTAIDPLWEKYAAWTPYHYAADNPLGVVDPDGRDIIILNNQDAAYGFGHNGLIVGNDEDGWVYYSKDGEVDGEMRYTEIRFKSLGDFVGSEQGKTYQHGAWITTDGRQDQMAQRTAQRELYTEFDGLRNNCGDLVDATLGSIGIKIEGGQTLFNITAPNSQFVAAINTGVADKLLHIGHTQQADPATPPYRPQVLHPRHQ